MKENRKAKLIEGPVGQTLFRLTVPMIMGIVSMVVFNLVDTFYVGRLGALELAALSFTFPVVMIIQSLALGLGVGTSVVISRAIGEGNHARVQRLTTDSLSLSVLIVLVFVTAGILTIRPVFRMLGASSELLPLIRQYMQIWYPGVLFVVVPMVGNNAIRAIGDTKTPSLIMIAAAGVNFILDPLLIFGVGPFPRLEIAGAALATVFARALALTLSTYVLCHREKMITLARVGFDRIFQSWRQILFIGIPTAATRMIIPLGVGVITRLISSYGPESVAAFGVASRVEFFALTVIMALSSVIGPFAGQNWGAGRFDRVKRSMQTGNRFSIGWGLFIMIVLFLVAKPVAAVFNNSPQVIDGVVQYMRIVPVGYGLYGVFVLSGSVLNVLKKPFHAAMLSFLQMFILYIPLAYLGSSFFGLRGIFYALAVSCLLTGLISVLLTNRMIATESREVGAITANNL